MKWKLRWEWIESAFYLPGPSELTFAIDFRRPLGRLIWQRLWLGFTTSRVIVWPSDWGTCQNGLCTDSAVAELGLGLRHKDPFSVFQLGCGKSNHAGELLASGFLCLQEGPGQSQPFNFCKRLRMLYSRELPSTSFFRWASVRNSSKTKAKKNTWK